MVALNVRQKTSVYSAISKCDEVGTAEFLEQNDCAVPKKFLIEEKGKTYSAKATLYVAHRIEQPQDHRKCRDFVGSAGTVARPLERLGFRIVIL
jgi:hypothetical protein